MAKTIDDYCKDCLFLNLYSRYNPHCDYIGHTGQSRGCPPGEGCTKKEVSLYRAKKQAQKAPDAS